MGERETRGSAELPRVLIIGYACEPGKGSEQGTGWNVCTGMAANYDVTVVTRCNNQEPIEHELAGKEGHGISFIYHDAGRFFLWLKRLRIISVQLYYTVWLFTLARLLTKNGKMDGYDIIHHLTFNTFEIPSLPLLNKKSKTVWGPIGGGQTAPWAMRSYFGKMGWCRELLRTLRVRLSAWNPLCRKVIGDASLVMFANHETEDLLWGACRGDTCRMIDVGVNAEKFSVENRSQTNTDNINLLFAGKFEKRKGVSVVLDVFARAARQVPELTCTFVGDGKDREKIMRLAKESGLESRIDFTGDLSHDAMAGRFSEADIFLFSSLRDTTGAIVLEAMASGLPTVCFDHQGVSIMVDDDCGIRVDPGLGDKAIEKMAEAVVLLAEKPELRYEMGCCAKQRVLDHYTWERKCESIDFWYKKLLSQTS